MKTEGVKKVYNEVQINPSVSLLIERKMRYLNLD